MGHGTTGHKTLMNMHSLRLRDFGSVFSLCHEPDNAYSTLLKIQRG